MLAHVLSEMQLDKNVDLLGPKAHCPLARSLSFARWSLHSDPLLPVLQAPSGAATHQF